MQGRREGQEKREVAGSAPRRRRRTPARHAVLAAPWTSARALPALLLVLAAAAGAAPVAAQDPDEAADTSVRGVVLDVLTGARLDGARVQAEGMRGGTLTDSLGLFALDRVPVGFQVLTVEHYGFEGVEVSLDVQPGMRPFVVELTPKPVMLEGLGVVTDRLAEMESRLRSRRRAVATSARAFDLERLTRSPARDMLEFLRFESSLGLSPCGGRWASSLCVFRRGRWTEPGVYIDEIPAVGGLDQLATYRPSELYLVEVYSSGLQIRAYTHNFMERMARRPMALIPIHW